MKKLELLCVVLFLSSAARAGWFGKKKAESPEPPPREQPQRQPSSTLSMPVADEPEEEPKARAKARTSSDQAPGELPKEVVIKGSGDSKLRGQKPPLSVEVDPYESIRDSLKPDESLLLAVSPLTVSWRSTHPEFLRSKRVIEPWRITFSPRPGIVFRPLAQLSDALARRLDPKEAKSYGWNLTIADEEGRVFHHYEGSSDPPEEILWSGQNDQGEWIKAGRSYSAVYTFVDSGGSPRTSVAKPLLFKGIVHQEDAGLYVSLDASVLFGASKTASELTDPGGKELMRAAADLVKRRFSGIPISVRVFASTQELGEAQGLAVTDFLTKELMLLPNKVSNLAARANYSEQRVEIVLLNR